MNTKFNLKTVLFSALALFSVVGLTIPNQASAVTALAKITAKTHFAGGQNLSEGSRRGHDATLGELIRDLQNVGAVNPIAAVLTGYVSGAGTVAATDTILQAINKLNGNIALKATNLLTGYVSGSGVVAATDTVLQGINKLNGNQVLSKATADAALPSASFTDAAVSGKLLTGYVSGAGVVAATDTLLQAINKLNGNGVATAAVAAAAAADATTALSVTSSANGGDQAVSFSQGVGAKTLRLQKINRMVCLFIPAGSTADGGGTNILSDTPFAATYRPAVAQKFIVQVTDSGAGNIASSVSVGSDGILTFNSSAAADGFADDAAAGWGATSVCYVSNG